MTLKTSTRPGRAKGELSGQPILRDGGSGLQSKNESRQSASVSLTTECRHPRERRETDPETKEIYCRSCGEKLQSSLVQLGGSEYGRSPNLGIVMSNNLGTSPGPERKKQVFSALNQSGEKQGLEFHLASLDVLTILSMGSETERKVSRILRDTVRAVEQKRGFKLDPQRIDAIARICKLGIKRRKPRSA